MRRAGEQRGLACRRNPAREDAGLKPSVLGWGVGAGAQGIDPAEKATHI